MTIFEYLKQYQKQAQELWDKQINSDERNEEPLMSLEASLEEYLLSNYTKEEIDDEYQECFHPQLHYSFKESLETDRNKYKAGVIVSAYLEYI
jgi:hypothetical protein